MVFTLCFELRLGPSWYQVHSGCHQLWHAVIHQDSVTMIHQRPWQGQGDLVTRPCSQTTKIEYL